VDHVRLYPTRLKPARQPEAVAAGFEGKRNPRDSAAGPDRLIPPAMQQGKQPFWARLRLGFEQSESDLTSIPRI
jgi:hypothetical protein